MAGNVTLKQGAAVDELKHPLAIGHILPEFSIRAIGQYIQAVIPVPIGHTQFTATTPASRTGV